MDDGGEGGEDTAIEPPKAVRWYPDRLAWQFAYSRQQLRRLPFLEAGNVPLTPAHTHPAALLSHAPTHSPLASDDSCFCVPPPPQW
jgi:hypothetical protein